MIKNQPRGCISRPRCVILSHVTEEDIQALAFGDALVAEIWAEMGRRGIRSVRALAERAGIDRGKLNARLTHNPRGDRLVAVGGEDLFMIARALKIEPAELVRRAYVASHTPPPTRDLGDVI